MGLIYPPPAQTTWQNNLQATPASQIPGTVLTANATIHTKATSYTTLIAATTYESFGFWLCFTASQAGNAASNMLCDIAIGAAASEVIIVPDIQCGWRGIASTAMWAHYYPIYVPRGVRLSARTQALITADTVSCAIFLNGGAGGLGPIFTGCDVYGVDAANSRGTLHTPGNTGAESTDANVGSATSRSYGAIALEIGCGALTSVNAIAYHWELTDGTNTIAEWYHASNAAEYIAAFMPNAPYYWCIPEGTQLMIQGEGSGTSQEHDVQYRCFF